MIMLHYLIITASVGVVFSRLLGAGPCEYLQVHNPHHNPEGLPELESAHDAHSLVCVCVCGC